MGKADIVIALYLLAAFIFLIIPMSPTLLDICLTVDMAISFSILFNSMFCKEVLDMNNFPTMLLFSTIFRISLNVSSTRLILTTGDAGNVVDTFGNFVGGGDLIIGAIIYIILLIVQFMVINKGTERIAEVTARFTLDAMPGKQMAIDADLNTGAIDDEEAKRRRDKIQDESSFFGAMDGATKYVKGDSTAGLVITAINVIGGIATGVLNRGMDIGAAAQRYTILTIGDGLISQIPSLLISLSTGILITKGSMKMELGHAIVSQLFSLPKVLYFTGAVICFLGIATPLNVIIFLSIGIIFIIAGRYVSGLKEEIQVEEKVDET
ncbi:MAG: FHIPEP family type III secretion protein, partial [Lachnospiraceae bacterium]|nr:FHIPEP family type III secretion protein [Lachnospiraceae bacterium]